MPLAANRYRLPAEWAPQAGALLVWPRAGGDWGKGLAAARKAIGTMAAALAARQNVLLVAPDAEARASIGADARLAELPRLRVIDCPVDDIWVRDFGPLTVCADGARRFLDFRFDGWGKRHPAARDDAVTAALHAAGAFGSGALERHDVVLEGGSIEVDGAGAMLTTRRCLLENNRNPGLDQSGFEVLFARHFGIQTTHWLAHGALIGDDTDGHIDTLARFAGPGAIVYQGCEDRADDHYAPFTAMARELQALRQPDGQPYRLHPLPLPRPVYDPADGRRLAAGYANFVIANGLILMPAYDDPADAVAQALLQARFPDRDVQAIDCRALIRQNGALHCAVMQLPAEHACAESH